jgi:hypothetical protein
MSPGAPPDHVKDCPRRHPIPDGDLWRGKSLLRELTNLNDLRRRQPGLRVVFPYGHVGRSPLAAFLDSVADVLGASSGEEVIGAHTRRIVAAMADMQTVRNRAVSKLVAHAVGGFTMLFLRHMEPAIPCPVACACPQPATILRLLDLRPESLCQRRAGASLRAAFVATLLTPFVRAGALPEPSGELFYREVSMAGTTVAKRRAKLGVHLLNSFREFEGATPRDVRASPWPFAALIVAYQSAKWVCCAPARGAV